MIDSYLPNALSKELTWLFKTQENHICLGLERMRFLLNELGHPEKKLRILHIAGTNGKGSTAAFTESLLRAAGYSTGLYTSPHLVNIEERIRLNGTNITTACLEEGIKRLQVIIQDWEEQPTFFELMTVLALDVFSRTGCEVVILETGLGGRLDATNITEKIACAITPISLDHTEYLGPTIAHLAREKAGIMRQGIPVISAPQQAEVQTVLHEEADKIQAPLEFITEPLSSSYQLGLTGSYQRWNASLALALVKKGGFNISKEAEREGFLSVLWPGRFERMIIRDSSGYSRTLILDGAHNPGAVEQLLATWKEEFPNKKPILIFGALADKEGKVMLQNLLNIASEVFLVPVASSRTRSPHDFLDIATTCTVCFSLQNAFNKLFFDKKDSSFLSQKNSDTPVLLTGSLFLVGEALALLQEKTYLSSIQ